MAANFADIGGGIGVVVDSLGMYAVCLDRRSAAAELALDVGEQVVIARGEDELVTTPVTFGREGHGMRPATTLALGLLLLAILVAGSVSLLRL